MFYTKLILLKTEAKPEIQTAILRIPSAEQLKVCPHPAPTTKEKQLSAQLFQLIFRPFPFCCCCLAFCTNQLNTHYSSCFRECSSSLFATAAKCSSQQQLSHRKSKIVLLASTVLGCSDTLRPTHTTPVHFSMQPVSPFSLLSW